MRLSIEYKSIDSKGVVKFYNEKPRHVTMFLEREGNPTGIHCIYCKKKLMVAQQNVCQVTPGSPPQELKHLAIKCQNSGCNTMYYFVSAV